MQATRDVDILEIFDEKFQIDLPLKEANFSFESEVSRF